MSAPGLPARLAAAELLIGVLSDGMMLGDLVDRLPDDLPPPARARAQSLAAMVLRNLEPIDTVLDQFLTRKPPVRAMQALRIAAAEMLID